jgi:hypothetical protein
VAWGGDFTQWQPHGGQAPAQQTDFKILYDEKFLYIAYRCHDQAPDSIVRRMGRRDEFPGDWVEINIDSYHDLRSAFSFTLSVSGVRSDEFVSNNGTNWDASWNPIWFAKAHVDDKAGPARSKFRSASSATATNPKRCGASRSPGGCFAAKNVPAGSTFRRTPGCG